MRSFVHIKTPPVVLPALFDVTGDHIADTFEISCENGQNVVRVLTRDGAEAAVRSDVCLNIEHSNDGDLLVISGDFNADHVDDTVMVNFEGAVPTLLTAMSEMVPDLTKWQGDIDDGPYILTPGTTAEQDGRIVITF